MARLCLRRGQASWRGVSFPVARSRSRSVLRFLRPAAPLTPPHSALGCLSSRLPEHSCAASLTPPCPLHSVWGRCHPALGPSALGAVLGAHDLSRRLALGLRQQGGASSEPARFLPRGPQHGALQAPVRPSQHLGASVACATARPPWALSPPPRGPALALTDSLPCESALRALCSLRPRNCERARGGHCHRPRRRRGAEAS